MSISIHALHEEGDTGLGGQIVVDALFLSTPSMRRATEGRTMWHKFNPFLSTPSMRRATCEIKD